MKDVNRVILVGRLGADPIERQTSKGQAVVNFSIATAWSAEETQWHRVVAWGREAESCAKVLRKGGKVYVEGALRTRKYLSKDGESKLSVEIHADCVSFLAASRAGIKERDEPSLQSEQHGEQEPEFSPEHSVSPTLQ